MGGSIAFALAMSGEVRTRAGHTLKQIEAVAEAPPDDKPSKAHRKAAVRRGGKGRRQIQRGRRIVTVAERASPRAEKKPPLPQKTAVGHPAKAAPLFFAPAPSPLVS